MSEGERNLSGEFSPKLASIGRWLDRYAAEKPDEGLHALSKKEKNEFFNQERTALAKRVFVSMNNELSEFGIKPFSFVPDIVDLFYYSPKRDSFAGAINRPTYANADVSGSLRMPVYSGLDNREFVRVLSHEAGHFFSAKITRSNNWRQRLINHVFPLTFRRRGSTMSGGKKRNYNMGYFFG